MSRTGNRNGSDYKSSMFFRSILLFSSSSAPLSRSLSETLLSPPKHWLHRTEVVYFFSKSSNTFTDPLCGSFHNDNVY